MKKLFAFLPVVLLGACGGGDSRPEIGRYNGRVTNVMENPNIKTIKKNVTGPEFKLETDNAQDIISRAAEIYGQLNPGENLYDDIIDNSVSQQSARVAMNNGLTKPDNNRTLEEKKLDKARAFLAPAKNFFDNATKEIPSESKGARYQEFLVMCGIDPETYAYPTFESFVEFLKNHQTETTDRDKDKIYYALPDEIANAINNPNLWYTQRNIANINMYTGGDIQIKGRIDVETNAMTMGIYAPNGTTYEINADDTTIAKIAKDKSTTYSDGKLTCIATNGCDWSKYLGFQHTISLSDMQNGITPSGNLAFGNRNLNGKLRYSDFGYFISDKNTYTTPTFIGGYDIKQIGTSNNIANLATTAQITESTVYHGNAYAVVNRGESVHNGDATLTVNMTNTENSLNMNFTDWYNITINSDNTTTWAQNWSSDTAPSDALATTDGIKYDGRYEFYGATQSAPATEVVGTGSFIMPNDSNNPSVDISFGASNYPTETE